MGGFLVATHDLRVFPIFWLHGSQFSSVINSNFRANESLAKDLTARPEISEQQAKTLQGRFDGPSQRQFFGTVTFHVMSRGNFFERRFYLGANFFGILAAGMEITAGRR